MRFPLLLSNNQMVYEKFEKTNGSYKRVNSLRVSHIAQFLYATNVCLTPKIIIIENVHITEYREILNIFIEVLQFEMCIVVLNNNSL